MIYRHSDVVHPTAAAATANSSTPCKSHELRMRVEKSARRLRRGGGGGDIDNAKLADDKDENASFTDETGSVISTPLSHHGRSKRQVSVQFFTYVSSGSMV